jgi:hypothetical protein
VSDNPVPAIEPAFEPEQVQRAESGFNYNDLPPDDANKVRAAARSIRNHLERSVVAIGRELVAIKPVVGHGKFTDWVRQEFRMENRTAQRYMSVATSFGDDCDRVSYLPPAVLFDLSGKKPHHIEARSRLLAQIAKGGRPGEAEVRSILRTSKPSKPLPDPVERKEEEPTDVQWSDVKPSPAVTSQAETMAFKIVESLPFDAQALVDLIKAGGADALAEAVEWIMNEDTRSHVPALANGLPLSDTDDEEADNEPTGQRSITRHH